MKTISEMQMLIKDAYLKLDELSKSLSEYSISEDTTISVDFEKLKAIGKRNSLYGHMLLKADEITKKQYITLLMSLVFLATENQERGWLLIQRIACGAEVKDELSDLSADALSLKEKQLDSFSDSIISDNLRTAFALDCMLVYLSCEHKNKKMLDYISKLMELVRCKEAEVKEISKLAEIIATQNSKAYFEFCLKDIKVKLSESLCYIMSTKAAIVDSLDEAMITDNEHIIVFNAIISKMSSKINLDDFQAKTIEFLYCKFENILGIKSQNKKVIFKNTIFTNIAPVVEKSKSIFGGNISKTQGNFSIIEISNCELSYCNFINCTASEHFILIEKGSISHCFFEQCLAVETPSDVYLIELINGDIESCKFDRCSIKTKRGDRNKTITGVVKLAQGNIRNSKFVECKSYGDSSYGSYANYSSYILYLSNSNAEQCDFVKCYCSSTDSSNKTCTHYIIALKNSNQKNNNFTECSSYNYRYSDIGSNMHIGTI